ncbi:MAG: helix-turn-helix domain-containing protein, partial [Halofilum sp. (in: g-proteobacteria)]
MMTTHTDHDTRQDPDLDEPRPGYELRTERERAGISREFMAERLRLAGEQLDALEHDDYAKLPPPAFVRGYIRAYARELGVDPDGYISAYNRTGVSGQDPEIRRGGVSDTSAGSRGAMIGLLLIVLVAAAGIGAWWYQQHMQDDNGGSGSDQSAEDERAATDGADTGNRDERDTDNGDVGRDNGTTTDGVGDDAESTGDQAGGTTVSDDASEDNGAQDGTAQDDTAGGDAGAAAVDVDAASATAVAAVDDTADAGREGDDDGEADADAEGEGEGEGEGTDEPTVVTTDVPSPERDDGDTVDGATEVAEAADDTAAGNGADDEAEDEPEGENDEPGADSPAATGSPTRVATDEAETGPDELTLEFSARSWLEVYDDRDRELAYTLYFGSDPVTLQGWAPFEIFLGNSPAVEVRFNGEEIDKSDFTRGNNT